MSRMRLIGSDECYVMLDNRQEGWLGRSCCFAFERGAWHGIEEEGTVITGSQIMDMLQWPLLNDGYI